EGIAHRLQDLWEAGAPPPLLRREIGSAPKRLALRGQKHRQRPAALLAQEPQRMLVDRIEIRAFLAVDLDVDEELVHPPGDLRVLEALMRHDMAPVAGRIPDRQQDRLLSSLGGGERLLAPGLPVNRIVLVLQEIGAGLFAEAIAVDRGLHDQSYEPGCSR